MNELFVQGLTANRSLPSLYGTKTDTEETGASFGSQLSAILAQSVLGGASGASGADGTDALMQSSLMLSLLQNGGEDSARLMLYMLMLQLGSGGGESGMGAMAAMSALASARTGRVSTASLQTAAFAYQTVNAAAATVPVSGQSIPSESWKPVYPPITNAAGARSAANYRAVINQFDVENNRRYAVNKLGNGDTYCNIFVWDVTRAMGAEIPYLVDAQTGEARSFSDTSGAYYMTANRMSDWLAKYGAQNGWKRVSAQEAQQYANQGHPAVAVWKNPNGHGHVQVVCPSADGTYDAQKGVTIAQAGRKLYDYAYISQVYGKNTLKDVAYYVHA